MMEGWELMVHYTQAASPSSSYSSLLLGIPDFQFVVLREIISGVPLLTCSVSTYVLTLLLWHSIIPKTEEGCACLSMQSKKDSHQ